MTLPLSREQAFELVKKYNSNETDIRHYLESEAVMRELSRKLDTNEEYYGQLGLLHDIDWGLTKENSRDHLTKTEEILKEAGYDNDFISTIMSHGYGFDCAGLQDEKRTKKDQFALAISETVTGLVYAYALMRGGKVSDMEASSLKKKFKDKKFAQNIRREIIEECQNLGLTVDEFLGIAIEGIKKIAPQVGLS